jgi:LacI family transcriptional regulator
MTVTTDQIAKKAGISRQTVSGILNGKGHLYRSETKALVMRVCAELGYKPNGLALALKSGKFNAMGLIASTKPNEGFISQATIEGIHDTLRELNWHLVSGRYDDEALTHTDAAPRLLRELLVDGLLINYTASMPQRLLDMIDAFDVPTVWLNSTQVGHNTVRPDDLQGAMLGTSHLIQSGHRRIAFFNPVHTAKEIRNPSMHFHIRDRYGGYERVMKQHGLKPTLIARDPALTEVQSLTSFSLDFLTGPNAPTALVCHGPGGLIRLMMGIAAHQARGGADIKVMVFAHAPEERIDVDITKIVVPHRDVGRHAAQMLARQIDNPKRHLASVALPCYLADRFGEVIRSSI